MLALARGDSVAAQALRNCGATHEALTAAYERLRNRWEEEYPRKRRTPPQLNPASYALRGRAPFVRFVHVPALDPPPDDDRPKGERVWIPLEKLELVLRELPSRLPEGSPFGFNVTADGSRAWVQAGSDVDLQSIVDDVLA
jgi:hypothetical protein